LIENPHPFLQLDKSAAQSPSLDKPRALSLAGCFAASQAPFSTALRIKPLLSKRRRRGKRFDGIGAVSGGGATSVC